VHQEAAGAGELVGLPRQDPDGQLLVRQVCAGQLEAFGCLRLVLVDLARVLVRAASLQLLDRVFFELFVGLSGRVLVGRHQVLTLRVVIVVSIATRAIGGGEEVTLAASGLGPWRGGLCLTFGTRCDPVPEVRALSR
jgi:hypothetical protein